MDNKNKQDNKKPTTFQQQSKPPPKQQSYNMQLTYYNSNKKYENAKLTHMELYALFLTENFDTIKKEIYNNINLKINTENGNLINAVIENESLDEFNKIQILQELINNRNIDVNEKNKYDQSPLHTACKKEYYEIIKFLIDKSDKTELDIFGNAPIHYLTQFILTDCDYNSYYSSDNASLKLIKPSLDDIKFFKLLRYVINTIITEQNINHVNDLKAYISFNKFFNIDEFENIITEKNIKIQDIKKDYNISNTRNKSLKNEIIYNEMSSSFKNLYKDFIIDENITEIELNKNIIILEQKSKNDINNIKLKITNNLNDILESSEIIKEKFFDNTVSTVFVLKYIYETLWTSTVEKSNIKIENFLENCKGYLQYNFLDEKLNILIKIVCIIKKYINSDDPIIGNVNGNYINNNNFKDLLDFSINKFNPSIYTYKNNKNIDPGNNTSINTPPALGNVNANANANVNDLYIDSWINFLTILKNNNEEKYKKMYNNIRYDVIFLIYSEFPKKLDIFKKMHNVQKNITDYLNIFNTKPQIFNNNEISSKDIKKNKIIIYKNNGYFTIKQSSIHDSIYLNNYHLIPYNNFYYRNYLDIEYNKNLFVNNKYDYILIGDCLINKNINNNLVDDDYYSIKFGNFYFGNIHTFYKDIEQYINNAKKKIESEHIIFCIYDCINILDESIIIFDKMSKIYNEIENKKNDIVDMKTKFIVLKNIIIQDYNVYDEILKEQEKNIDIALKEHIHNSIFFNELYKKIIELLNTINKLIIEYNKKNSIKYIISLKNNMYNEKEDNIDNIDNFATNKFKSIINNEFPKNFEDYMSLSDDDKKQKYFYLDDKNYNNIYITKVILDEKNNLITSELSPNIYTYITEDDTLLDIFNYKYLTNNDILNKYIGTVFEEVNVLYEGNQKTIGNQKISNNISQLIVLANTLSKKTIFLPIFLKLVSLIYFCLEKYGIKNTYGKTQNISVSLISYFEKDNIFLIAITEISAFLVQNGRNNLLLRNIINDVIELKNIKTIKNSINPTLDNAILVSQKVKIVLKLYIAFEKFKNEYNKNKIVGCTVDDDNIKLGNINMGTPNFTIGNRKSYDINLKILNNSIKFFSYQFSVVDGIKKEDLNFLNSINIFSEFEYPFFKDIDKINNFIINSNKFINNEKFKENIIINKKYRTALKYNTMDENIYNNYIKMLNSQYLIKKINKYIERNINNLNNIFNNTSIFLFTYSFLTSKNKYNFIKDSFAAIIIIINSANNNKKLQITAYNDTLIKIIKKNIDDQYASLAQNFEDNSINISELLIKKSKEYTRGYYSTLSLIDDNNKKSDNIIYADIDVSYGNYIIIDDDTYTNNLSILKIKDSIDNNPIISLYQIKNIISIIFDKIYKILENNDFRLLKNYFKTKIKDEFKSLYNIYKDFINQENVVKNALKSYLESEIFSKILIEITDIKKILKNTSKIGGAITDADNKINIKEQIKNEMQKITEKNAFSIGHVTKLKINKAIGNKLFSDKCYNNNTIEKILSFNFDLLQRNTDGLSFLDIIINQFNYKAVEEIIKKLKNIEIPDRINININNYIINKSLKYDNIDKEVNEFQKKLISKLNNTKEFDYLGIDIRNTFIINTIMNSFYIFNEFIWLHTNKKENNINGVINKLYDILLKIINIDNTKLSISNINSSNIDEYSRNIAHNEKKLRGDNYDKKDRTTSDMDIINNKLTTINDNNIKKAPVINDSNIDYNIYNNLIKNDIKEEYIKIIALINNNKDTITNANLKIISESKNIQNIDYFCDYLKIINNKICINYFDFDKNDYYNTNISGNNEYNNIVSYNIIEILKLNLLNILTIAILDVLNIIGKKKDNAKKNNATKNTTTDDTNIMYTTCYDIVKNMLYDIMIDHNNILMSPNKTYENFNTYKVQIIKLFLELYEKSDDDEELNKFLEQLFEFYKIITEDISEYIYNMFVEYIKDLQQLYYLYEIKKILLTVEIK